MPTRGLETRQQVQDVNQLTGRENTTKILIPQTGIQAPRKPDLSTGPNLGNILAQAFAGLGAAQQNKDFLSGQMDYVRGKVEADVAATGNKTSMAGFMMLSAGASTDQWQNEQMSLASGKYASMAPEEYKTLMHEKMSTFLDSANGDEYTEQVMMTGLTKSVTSLVAAQTKANKAFTLDATVQAYGQSLLQGSTQGRNETDAITLGNNSADVSARLSDSSQSAIKEIEKANISQDFASAPAMDISELNDVSGSVGSNWNFGTMKANALIVHHTAGRPTVAGVIQTFKDRNFPAHFVVDREGQITEKDRSHRCSAPIKRASM